MEERGEYNKPGMKVYADLGVVSTRGLNGEKYYATDTDYMSGTSFVYVLKSQSDQFSCFKNFVEKMN
jgi:hypothetical protein